MIDVDIKFTILNEYFVNGVSIGELVRKTCKSKNTIRKYLREYSKQKDEILASGDKNLIFHSMAKAPTYNAEKRTPTVVTDEILDVIKDCLLKNESKRANGQRKLCMKATDIYELLIEKNYKISYPSVTNYVRKLSNLTKEAFIKQHYEFGEICEFDWGDVPLEIFGQKIVFKMAVFTLAASNTRFAVLYRNENTQSFIDAHVRFFSFLGRVPKLMIYDNMRVAVAKFVGKSEKVPTLALKQISTYYGFSFRFCNICSGNEKGHVERSVEFVRRKAFCTVSSFDSFDEALARLNKTISNLNSDKLDLLEQEKQAMIVSMPAYSSVIMATASVDKYSTFCYLNNHYSAPDHLVGKDVHLLVFVDEILVKFEDKTVAKHTRCYDKSKHILDIMHYRKTLMRKPGAIANSLCLKQSCDLLNIIFNDFFLQKPKEFIKMLDLLEQFSLKHLKNAIETLQKTGANIQLDGIKMVLFNKNDFELYETCDDIEKACEIQLLSYCQEVVV